MCTSPPKVGRKSRLAAGIPPHTQLGVCTSPPKGNPQNRAGNHGWQRTLPRTPIPHVTELLAGVSFDSLCLEHCGSPSHMKTIKIVRRKQRKQGQSLQGIIKILRTLQENRASWGIPGIPRSPCTDSTLGREAPPRSQGSPEGSSSREVPLNAKPNENPGIPRSARVPSGCRRKRLLQRSLCVLCKRDPFSVLG